MTDDIIDRIQDVLIAKLAELDPADVEQAAVWVALVREVDEWRAAATPAVPAEKPKKKRTLLPEHIAAMQKALTCDACGNHKNSKAHKEACRRAATRGESTTRPPPESADDGDGDHPWKKTGQFGKGPAAVVADAPPGPGPGADGHVHHWIIKHVEGRGQVGTCKECDEERVYDPLVVTGFSERGEGGIE